MNRQYQKLLAMLLSVVMILGLLPVTAFAADADSETDQFDPSLCSNSYIPVKLPGGKAVTEAYLSGDRETYDRYTGRVAARDTLPSKFDARTYNWVTSVKNQGSYGSCWAHAAMGSLEGYMISHSIPAGSGPAPTKDNLNLSETQHSFFTYTRAYDAEGMLNGDKTTAAENCMEQGGNGEMSAYTLMRWTGAADESESALRYSNASAVNYSGLNSKYAYQYDDCHVQNTEWIPGTDVEAIKHAIMNYGSGNISYYAGDDDNHYTYTYQCTIDNTSQDDSNHKWANHSITLIGWDDSIQVSKFSPNKPSRPGAWLCKNSWGTGYFDNGYCYISYEDSSVCEDYIFFYDAEPIDNYQHNYQYDGTCNLVTFGKGWNSTAGTCDTLANGSKVANVFTAKGNETLRAISFCSWDEGLSYTVEIYKNPTAGNPSSGTLAATQSGTLTFCGYYTVKLDTPVVLNKNESFSVVVTQSVQSASAGLHVPYDASFSNSSVIDWCTWTHANHGATSYYKEPGGAWTDCPDNGDYRVKAYTDDTVFQVSAVSNNDAWGTVSVEGYTITAAPAAGYCVSDYEVVSGTATAVIEVNTVTVTPESDCTIRVIFAPKPLCTVYFVASGNYESSLSAPLYDTITLPTTVSIDAEDWTLCGWSETQIPEAVTEVPEFYAPGATYTVMGDGTLYAVFSRVSAAPNAVYELVTAAPSDWSGRYVLTSGKDDELYAFKGIDGDQRLENTNCGATVAYNSTGMTLNGTTLSGVDGAYVFTVAKKDSVYTIKSATGYWIGTQSTRLHNMGSYQEGFSDWNVSYDSNSNCMIIANVASTTYTYLTLSSYYYFSVGKQYNVRKTYLWKETAATVTYYGTQPVSVEHVHQMEYVAHAAPTCAAAGHSAYYHCVLCNKYYSDEAGEHEITLESTVIPATGNHSYGNWISNNDGTHKHVCSVCGDTQTVNCSYGSVVKEPTCTEGGYTTYTCADCGYSYQGNPIDALGHNWNEGEVIQEPTQTEPGVKRFTCRRCNAVENRPIPALSQANPFVDVSYGKYYYDAVIWAYYHDPSVTSGTDETHFSPYAPCTREQFVFFLWAANGKPAPNGNAAGFTDVKPNQYYYQAVIWAKEQGITNGISETLFGVGRYCTREEAVTFLWRNAGSPKPGMANPFTDVSNTAYYAKAVRWAVENGVTGGTSAAAFSPKKLCTRAEVVTFLYAAFAD